MSSDAPNFIETVVCLSNSRKTSGRCVAGKRTSDQSWVRPVSNRPDHEISENELRYQDGKTAQLLDIIEIPCIQLQPQGYQSENVVIDDQYYWEKKARASWQDIVVLVEQDADLWVNGYSAYKNQNNRIPEAFLDRDAGSLRLIELDEIVLHAGPKAPAFGNMKPSVRASFEYGGQDYKLDVTDRDFERACLKKGEGEYPLRSVIACISLSQPHTNQNGETFAYKLVASIITKDRAAV
jgi:hypothetical protein